jgi:hypothetical protein
LQDIARLAGVGKATVSLALRDDPRLRPETRERIQKIANEIGYRANATVSALMAQLRASHTPRYQATLGLVNASSDRDTLKNFCTFRDCVTGCVQRAWQLGYGLDDFWLREPGIPPRRLVARRSRLRASCGNIGCCSTGPGRRRDSLSEADRCGVGSRRRKSRQCSQPQGGSIAGRCCGAGCVTFPMTRRWGRGTLSTKSLPHVVLHAKQDICVRAKQDMGSTGRGEVEADGLFTMRDLRVNVLG